MAPSTASARTRTPRLQRHHHRCQDQEPGRRLLRRHRHLRRRPPAKQLRQQGLTIPFTGPDGINNGTGKDKGSLFQIAGPDASKNTYSTVAAIGDFPAKADFDARFTEAFKDDRTSTPRAPTEGRATPARPSSPIAEGLPCSEPRRRSGCHPRRRPRLGDRRQPLFETVLGKTTFDKNGDTSQPYISFYAEDPAGADGTGAWKFMEQRNYANNP